MAFKEQLEYAAAVTKWKADQQVRIVKIQGQISDMENTVKGRVYALGEATMQLQEQGELTQPSLLDLTAQITGLKQQIVVLQQSLTAVKAESGPQRPQTQTQPQPAYSGLVCPQCGAMLKGNFCPEHGVPGVPPVNPQPVATTTPAAPADRYIICPVCNKLLNGRFCPEHGVEGVWMVTPTSQDNQTDQTSTWTAYEPQPPANPQANTENINPSDL